jgi:cutinase
MRSSSLLLISLLPLLSLVLGAPTPSLEERDLNAFLAQIAVLMPFSGLIQDISGLLEAATATLGSLTGTKSTQDDLSGACAAVTVIFARGTTEPGNVGVLAGPPFFNALKNKIGAGNVAVQGVSYPASVEGFLLGGDDGGAQTMANLVTQAFSKCPSTKVVMGAYSQGGQLLHKAAKLLPVATMQAVKSVVIFGDPGMST